MAAKVVGEAKMVGEAKVVVGEAKTVADLADLVLVTLTVTIEEACRCRTLVSLLLRWTGLPLVSLLLRLQVTEVTVVAVVVAEVLTVS